MTDRAATDPETTDGTTTDPSRSATDRAQSETVGTVLLLGVVVLAVGAFGAFYVADAASRGAFGAGGEVRIDGDASPEALELVHRGGASLPFEEVRVIARNDTDRVEHRLSPADVTDGDGDSLFEAGERVRLGWDRPVGETVRVLVVDEAGNRVLYDETLRVA